MFRLALSAILIASASALAADHSRTVGSLRAFVGSRAEGFVRALEFKHRLRVCNAYPFAASLDVLRGKTDKLTGDDPMPYKACRDFMAPLHSGDKLEFKVGDMSTGTFSVADLPSNDAVLLLVVHRHDTLSTAVSFESHVFANLESAQVAVIDTYKGVAKATTRIMDAKPAKDAKAPTASRSEELRFDSVVAVNPGVYQVMLADKDGKEEAKSELVALAHESYVVLRTGVEAQQGQSFTQELVVFPKSDKASLHSFAGRFEAPLALLVALFTSVFARA